MFLCLQKDEKPSTANKESSSNSSAPIDRDSGNIGNLSDDADGGKPAQKKRGGGGNKKRRNKQKESIDSDGERREQLTAAAAFLPPKTDASQTDEKSTVVAVAAESASAAGRNYDLAKDQDLSNDACKVSSSPVAAFTRGGGEDDRSPERSAFGGIDTGSEVESRLSNYGFKPKAPPTTTNRNGHDDDDEDDEGNDDDEASENTSVRARGRLVVLPTKSQPHESVKVNSAIAEHDAMDTDGHRVMREETERQGELGASELLGRREINESITAENREGRDREETGFKHDDKSSSAAPRASITYADARASFSDESLTAWQGKAAIDEKEEATAAAADGSELLQTKMEPGLMYSANTTLGDNDLALALTQDGGASGRARNSHKDTINSFYPSRDMIDARDSKLFSGRRQLGLLLTDGGSDDVTRRAAAAVLPPGEIKDNAMIKTEIESKAGCGRRLEFSSEQRRHDAGRSPDMQSGVDVRPLQNNGSRWVRLFDVDNNIRTVSSIPDALLETSTDFAPRPV